MFSPNFSFKISQFYLYPPSSSSFCYSDCSILHKKSPLSTQEKKTPSPHHVVLRGKTIHMQTFAIKTLKGKLCTFDMNSTNSAMHRFLHPLPYLLEGKETHDSSTHVPNRRNWAHRTRCISPLGGRLLLRCAMFHPAP